jgi:cytidine deaminase
MEQLPLSLLSTLLEKAEAALAHSYSPYSQFPVGAAILTQDGTIFQGANIENASFSLTMCAERVALFKAATECLQKPVAIKAVSLYTKAPIHKALMPCGACRQVLVEWMVPGGVVITQDPTSQETVIKTIEELLPDHFDLI